MTTQLGAQDAQFLYLQTADVLTHVMSINVFDPATAPPNHSPRFQVDESALLLGVRSLAHLACDWLEAQ